ISNGAWRSGEGSDAMTSSSQRDRRRELIPCAVMVFLFLLLGGLCSTLLNSCRSGSMWVGPRGGVSLVLCGTTILGLAVGVIALVFATRHHDMSDAYCLGIVIGLAVLAIFAAWYSYSSHSPLYHVNESIWSQVGGYGFYTLFLLPPLAALLYGLA